MPLLHLETQSGRPILVGKAVITPVAQVLRLQFPWVSGGLIWNRPVAVRIKTADGQEQMLRVQDVTRLSLLALLGFSLICALLIRLAFRRNS